jgi:hypothetical protein
MDYPIAPSEPWISVDPGLGGMGWALWVGKRLVRSGAITAPHKLEWFRRAQWAGSLLAQKTDEARIGFYELPQFLASRYEVNASQDIIKLTMAAGIAVGILEAQNCTMHPVRIIDWKGQVSKELCNARVRKILARYQPGYTMGGTTHENDAIGIGLFILGRF